MSRDVVAQCIDNVSKIIEIITSCSDCFEVYIDFNPLRYPYVSIFVMLTKCEELPEACATDSYSIVMEMVLKVDLFLKDVIDLERDVTDIRISCRDGWFEYGFTVQRSSQSIAYSIKGFSVVYGGRRYSVESIDRALVEKLSSSIKTLIRRAWEVMDQEGII
jgi:hypothetical protein